MTSTFFKILMPVCVMKIVIAAFIKRHDSKFHFQRICQDHFNGYSYDGLIDIKQIYSIKNVKTV